MPRILSFKPNQPELEKENPLKSIWEEFVSLDKFTKGVIITFLLIVLATPFIIANYQLFTPKAQENKVDDALVSSSNAPEFVSNELLIKVKKDVKDKVKEGKPQDTGITTLDKVNKEFKAKKFERVAKVGKNSNTDHDLFAWYIVTLDIDQPLDSKGTANEKITAKGKLNQRTGNLETTDPSASILQDYITNLKNDPNIESIDLNYIMHTTAIPNDPYYSSTGSWRQKYDDLWGLKKINMEAAWDQTTGSASIVVAVIDSGVDRNHPDIAANMWVNTAEIPNNKIDDDSNGYTDDYYGWDWYDDDNDPIHDKYGHGTHIAGTIAAVGNNDIGVVGVNWKTRIMALRTSIYFSSFLYDVVGALVYAADMGARVSSNSWGCDDCQSVLLTDSVDYEHDKGMVVVTVAGNENADALSSSPSDANYAITVAASDPDDFKASFSNWGEKIDVAAPGVDILSLRAAGKTYGCTLRTIVGTNYCRSSGTSMAAPHVSGLAALILSKNPSLTNEEVRQIIRKGAKDLGAPGKDPYFGYGRIDAARSMSLADKHLLAPIITSPRSRDIVTVAQLPIIGSIPGPNFASYKVEVGQGRAPTSWSTVSTSTIQPVSDSILATVDIAQLPVAPSFIFRITATDTFGEIYQFQVEDVLTQEYMFVLKWGSSGSGDGQFRYPQGIAVDSDNNVYVLDYRNHRIQKFTSTGTFITKWGSSGSEDGQFQFPQGIAVDSGGNVYVADSNNHRIQKFTRTIVVLTPTPTPTPTATPTPTPNPAPWLIIQENPSGSTDIAWSAAVDSTGLYVVGTDRSPGNAQWRMEKRDLTTGTILWTQTSNPSIISDAAYDVAVDSTGLYVVGADSSPGDYQWRIEKLDLAGNPLWTQTSDPSVTDDVSWGAAVDSTGLYVVGYDHSLGRYQWRMEKRDLTTGTILWTQTSDPSGAEAIARDVAVDSTGLYVVGDDKAPDNIQWRIEKRDLTTGTILWTQTSNPSGNEDVAHDVAVDSTGLYVVGLDTPPINYQWHMEKRDLTAGTILWTQTSNPSGSNDEAWGAAVDSTGLYVVGYDNSPGNAQWRMEKRDLATGD